MLKINTTNWERSDHGPLDQRASAAHLRISAGGTDLTENLDMFSETTKPTAYLPASLLAEWFAWNWYRIRWEPKRLGLSWALSHRMATVGGGFVWPNITLVSDGFRLTVSAKPTKANTSDSLRYLADFSLVCPATDVEREVDRFILQVLARLSDAELKNSNLQSIWNSVLDDRADPELDNVRKLEALLGYNPDQAPLEELQKVADASEELGARSFEEVSATGKVYSIEAIGDLARPGAEFRPADFIHMPAEEVHSSIGEIVAWKAGALAAHKLRQFANLRDGAVGNRRLAEIAAVGQDILARSNTDLPMSVMLDTNDFSGKINLQNRHPMSRRFELARLVGDRVFWPDKEKLAVATSSQTYRQKFQRAFAGEFLCPFEALKEVLDGDYSPDSIEEAADHFQVSPLLVRTHLVNKNLLPRDDLDNDIDTAA